MNIQIKLYNISILYTRYPIVACREWPAGCIARAKVSCTQISILYFKFLQNIPGCCYERNLG